MMAWFKAKARSRPYSILLGICAGSLVVAILSAYLGRSAGDNNIWTWALTSSIAVNVMTSFVAVLLGINHLEREIRNQERLRQLTNLIGFWGRENFRSEGFKIFYGGKLGAFRDDEQQYSSLATIYGVQALTEMFNNIFPGQDAPEHMSFDNVKPNDAKRGSYHVILLGGYMSIKVLERFPDLADLQYTQDFSDPEMRRIRIGRKTDIATELDDRNDITTDYAMVTIAVEESGRHLFWFSGNYGIGTYGALLTATRNEECCRFEHPGKGRFYQAIIKVSSVRESSIEPDHEDITIEKFCSGHLPKGFSIGWLWEPP
jgi:hypothetical protein